jgi:hypothetical protein
VSSLNVGVRPDYAPVEWAKSLGGPVAVTQYRERFREHMVRDGAVRLRYDLGHFGLHVTTYAQQMPRYYAVELMEGQMALLMLGMPSERLPRPEGEVVQELMEVNGQREHVLVSRFVTHRFFNVDIAVVGKVLIQPRRTVVLYGTEPQMSGVALFDMHSG